MSAVWELDLAPGEKLVLLALADQANDEGRQCWPSVASIGKKSGQGERTVRRLLADLEEKGHLTRYLRDGTSTQYHIHPGQNGTPDKSAEVPKQTKPPANLAPKPSRNTNSQKATPSSKARAKPKTIIPNDFRPLVEADSRTGKAMAAWPPGELEEQVEHFIDHHTAKQDTSACWQASWRTWVKLGKRFNGKRPANDHRNEPQNAMFRVGLAEFGTG
jgi:hypothetical protein